MDRDRQVTDWLYGGNYHALWGALVMGIFALVATMAGFPVPLGNRPLILFPVAMTIGFVVGKIVGGIALGGSGLAAQQIYMPGAAGSYAQTHSHIDALEARGNFQGAADEWEKVAIAQPGNAWPFIRAGELYMRSLGEPARALERFRLARDASGISVEHHLYVTQKIVDLYLGPLNDPGRALVELSRLAQQRPGTREAAFAREAIARIKAERPPE